MKAITHRILTAGVILAILLGLLPFGAVSAAPALFVTPGATVFINEIHYDNAGTDSGEAIEIAGPAGTDLTGWSIVLYNGNGGAVYNTRNLSGTIPDQGSGFGTLAFTYPVDGIQNGSPDGVALVNNGAVVMFLSYEGTMTAVGGAANGLTSTDIVVAEASTTTVGFSLQLTGSGATYDDFTWAAAAANTFGAVNAGQSFVVVDNQPVTITCGEDITTVEGEAVVRQITASDPDGIVTSITAEGLVDGITLTDLTPADAVGGTASANLSVADTVAAGSYSVTITAANDDETQQTASCTVNITVSGVLEIGEIQGSGASAAITGAVITEGVVVGDYEGPSPALRGFYIQDPDGDGNPATSDGIFVFNGNNDSVALGDLVRVNGTASEFQDQTQISSSSITKIGTGTVAPVDVTFPVPSTTYLEQFEGMLVRLPQTMVVTEHFQLGRFGQVVISVEDRLQQPTNVLEPGPEAAALQDLNNRSKIILDDALNNQNPDPIIFSRNETALTAENTLRGGDTITGAVGVMTYTWAGNSASGNAYRVRPIGALGGAFDFVAANPRPEAAPEVGGRLKVVAMNTLNLFNTWDGRPDNADNCTLGVGGGATDCRGADNEEEFNRQWPKTVDAILEIDPDVLGVNEIENDGYGPDSAIAFLVDKLNEATAPGTYAFIDADALTGQLNALGTDAIKVGLIYKPATVTPIGQTAALNTVAFVNGGDSAPRSRPSLIQAFTETATGSSFIVSVNHLKSKGSACDTPDAGDGQGNCNTVRLNAVNELLRYLATDPTGTGDPDVLIIGDLNSYAKEDPIRALEDAGYTNLVSAFIGPEAYSYVFDGQWGYLDHALGSPSIVSQVTGAGEYHINADEPSVLDYNTDFKTANLINTLYAPDEFRVSDHDPVIVGLDLFVQKYGSVDAEGRYNTKKGSYKPNPKVNGKATFDISAAYELGTNAIVGALDYRLAEANLHLVSSGFSTLTITDNVAALGGVGTVNGSTQVRFLVTLIDGTPYNKADRIRMQIWTVGANGETLLYDDGHAEALSVGQITVSQ